jgi:hypothetical protein
MDAATLTLAGTEQAKAHDAETNQIAAPERLSTASKFVDLIWKNDGAQGRN